MCSPDVNACSNGIACASWKQSIAEAGRVNAMTPNRSAQDAMCQRLYGNVVPSHRQNVAEWKQRQAEIAAKKAKQAKRATAP